MERHFLTVVVDGRPATFATAAERPWKAAVREAIARTGVAAPSCARFGVRVEFRTPVPRTLNDAWDLDNLVKPTLDAMEDVFGARPVRGKMVPQANDDRVDRLELRKRTVGVGELPGATIDVWIIQGDLAPPA